jgi:hypothetical protein
MKTSKAAGLFGVIAGGALLNFIGIGFLSRRRDGRLLP